MSANEESSLSMQKKQEITYRPEAWNIKKPNYNCLEMKRWNNLKGWKTKVLPKKKWKVYVREALWSYAIILYSSIEC